MAAVKSEGASRSGKLCTEAGISQEHEADLEKTIAYMEEHRI